MKTNKLEITTGGISSTATERSRGLIKDVYYAMKRKKLFYQFQKSFEPMKGMSAADEHYLVDVDRVRKGENLIFKNIKYRPNIDGEERHIPKLWYDLVMISRMLHLKNEWSPRNFIDEYFEEGERYYSMTRTEVLGHYVDLVFNDYEKTHKLKPTGISFEFLFGMIGMLLFTIALFAFLAISISKGVAFIFGAFIALVTVIGLIFLIGD